MTQKRRNTVGHFLRKCKVIKIIAVIALIAAAGGFFWWQTAIKALAPESKNEKVFVVKRGEGLSSIAERLGKEGLIRSPLVFKIIVWTKGFSKKIQAGSFRIGSFLTPLEIANLLTHGTNDIWLTFPEGWRKEEIGRRLANNLENFDEQEFLKLTENLEGYLFPDTYLIPKYASPSAIAKILTENFEKKTKDLEITKQQLILASIVERETKHDNDRPIVAGILIKRWQQNWPLQADATVQYAVANAKCRMFPPVKQASPLLAENIRCEWWPMITKEDLKIDSPYNTYKYKGLPPTPICNPGLAAIKAVVNPTLTDYWYYLSDENGNIHFAKTLKEHQENIIRYLK